MNFISKIAINKGWSDDKKILCDRSKSAKIFLACF